MKLNPYSLSNTEIELKEGIESHKSIVFLSSFESNVKHQFINAFLFESLEKGKTFVFRVNDAKLFVKDLKERGLSDFALYLEKDTQITEAHFSKLKSISRKEQVAAIKARISYTKALGKIRRRASLYNEEVFGKHPRLKLAELLYLSKKRKKNVDLELLLSSRNYDFNQGEFWEIRSDVERAAKYYKPSFSFLKSSDQFQDGIYREFHLAEKQTALFKNLQEFINESNALAERYKRSFRKIKSDLLSKYNQHLLNLQMLLEELEKNIEFYKIEEELSPSKKNFGRNKVASSESQKIELRTSLTLLLDELKSTDLIKVNPPENDAQPRVKELEAFCCELQDAISKKHLLIHHKVEEQLEILNSNNYDAPELAALAREQSDLIYSINASQLLKHEIHNLSISAWKNYQFLKNLNRNLIKERLFLEANKDYAVYRSFEFTLAQKVLDIIEALTIVKTSEWVEDFETWYFQSLFNKYAQDKLSGIEKNFSELRRTKRQDLEHYSNRVRSHFLAKIENSDGFNRKTIVEGSNWKSLMLSAPDTFRGYFPIIVCDEDFFSSEVANFEYDYLVCIENKEVPQSIFSNSHFSSIICLHNSPLSKEMRDSAYTSKNYTRKKVLTLKAKNIPEGSEVMSILKNKITLSKALTHILGLSKLEKHFYSAKDFSIITCLSPFCTKLLELELLDLRIKPLKYTHLESGIVEDVILKEDNSKYLILQDGFIDSFLDLEWQIDILQRIENAGIKVLMINTEHLAISKKTQILDFVDIPELSEITKVHI